MRKQKEKGEAAQRPRAAPTDPLDRAREPPPRPRPALAPHRPSPADRQPREVRHLEQVELAPAAEHGLDDLAPGEAVQVLLLEVAVRVRRADVAQVPQPVRTCSASATGRAVERG